MSSHNAPDLMTAGRLETSTPLEACREGLLSMKLDSEKAADGSAWFAAWTKSRQEKPSAIQLDSLSVEHFLPLKAELRQWTDRRQEVSVPLFPGYLFVRINPAKSDMLRILKVPGIVNLVGNSMGPLSIPDHQINDVRMVLSRRMPYEVLPILKHGERVRVMRGALAGVEGTLMNSNSASRLMITVDSICQAIVVNVARHDVESIDLALRTRNS